MSVWHELGRPVVRGPASTYLMSCCGVSVMVPGGEAVQRAHFFYRLCPTTIREWANGHVDMCHPVVRGPASTYLMKCCGVSVMVPGGEVARQRAPLLTGSVPPPHHMAGGAARREERGHEAGAVGRTHQHPPPACTGLHSVLVCLLLSRAFA